MKFIRICLILLAALVTSAAAAPWFLGPNGVSPTGYEKHPTPYNARPDAETYHKQPSASPRSDAESYEKPVRPNRETPEASSYQDRPTPAQDTLDAKTYQKHPDPEGQDQDFDAKTYEKHPDPQGRDQSLDSVDYETKPGQR
ncbi:MAG: hypothetical protein AB7S38_08935 [Vulcanimicrobiota bacterium]